jgi:outer membrane protein OmpA-like peptidoglycan-associated protein
VTPKKPRVRGIVGHLRIFPVVLSLLLPGSALVSCSKKEAPKPDPAEVAPSKEALKQSYDGLKPQLEQQVALLAGVRKRTDLLPSDEQLPGLVPLRAKLHSVEEVLGVTSAKVGWLAGELETATSAGKSEELLKVSKQVSATVDDLRDINRVGTELAHQLVPFERTAALLINPATAFTRELPTGYKLEGAEGGLEQSLLDFLADSKRPVDADSWLLFDHVFFVSGAKLDRSASKAQLQNVVEIFKAYPNVKLKIGSFTDTTVDAAASKQLTVERAAAVKAELVALGIKAARLEAEGFGQAKPVCAANDTEECRSKNRRVAAHVMAK